MNRLILPLAILLTAAGIIWWTLGAQTSTHAGETSSGQLAGLAPIPSELGHGLSVDQAYSAIPHARTAFLSQQSPQSPGDSRYLATLFSWTDLAIVERVANQQSLRSSPTGGASLSGYDVILEGISSLNAPAHLYEIQELIKEAITEQRAYLAEWQASGQRNYFNRKHLLVQSSHRKLISAYKKLMAAYSDEGAHNKQAFFDHLCALDFI